MAIINFYVTQTHLQKVMLDMTGLVRGISNSISGKIYRKLFSVGNRGIDLFSSLKNFDHFLILPKLLKIKELAGCLNTYHS